MEGRTFGHPGLWAKEIGISAQKVFDPLQSSFTGNKKQSTSASWMLWGKFFARLGQIQSKSNVSFTYGGRLWYLLDPDM